MILIRADANEEIGTGHMMRCLSIAEQSENKANILFVVADERGEEIVEKRGFSSLVLHTNFKSMETELSVLSQLICQLQVEMILVDSYHITKKYISELSSLASVSLIEDFLTETYDVRNLINYNIYAQEEIYQRMYQEKNNMKPHFLLGPFYAPLRTQFKNVNFQVRNNVTSILLTTGGTDPLNLAGEILNRLLNNKHYQKFTYRVVCGIFNENREHLKEIEKVNPNVILYEDISDMAVLMVECDIAISAAGTTMYELAAVGLPTISYAFINNQDLIATGFAKEKMALYAGESTIKLEERITNIMKQFKTLINDFEIRKEMHQTMVRKVDGMGAKRIYDCLMGVK